MEKQLVDALKGVNRLSDLDEISKDMIADRAYTVWERYNKLLDAFINGFEELTTDEPELCHLIGINILMAATDDYVIRKNKELNRDKPTKCTVVYGDTHTSMMLNVTLAKEIFSDENIVEDTDDED
jgi:hypothetical protein